MDEIPHVKPITQEVNVSEHQAVSQLPSALCMSIPSRRMKCVSCVLSAALSSSLSLLVGCSTTPIEDSLDAKITACAYTQSQDHDLRERLLQECRATIENKSSLPKRQQPRPVEASAPRVVDAAKQRKYNEATNEMRKALVVVGLSPDHVTDSEQIVKDLIDRDPDFFRRYTSEEQYIRIAGMIQEGMKAGTIRPTPDERLVNELTDNEEERFTLRWAQRLSPEHKNDRAFLTRMLAAHRDYAHRYEVNTIKMRHQYPRASEQELKILIDDATKTEWEQKVRSEDRAIEQVPDITMPDFPTMMHCTSSRLGGFTTTDCY